MKKLLQEKSTKCIFLVMLLFTAAVASGQVIISQPNTAYNTSFNGWNNTMPTGFTKSGSGQAYVGTSASTTGGTYAISNSGFGYQPSSSASNLTLTGTFRNSTGAPITKLEISYKAFMIVNRASRTPGWAVTSSLGDVSGLNWTYNSANTASSPSNETVTITLTNAVANNSTFTLTFNSDRGGGSSSSPMIGLKDISVKAIPTNVAPTLGGTLTSVTTTFGSPGSLAFTSAGTPAPTFALSPTPSTATTAVPAGITLGTNVVNVANNVPVGTYYIRITASNTSGNATRDITVTVNAATPQVTTVAFNNQDDATTTTANLTGSVTNTGGVVLSQRGFVWNLSNASLNVGDETTVVDADDTDDAFTSAIQGLTPNTRYYYRAFATNSATTAYGATNNFYTKAATPNVPALSNATTTSLTLTNDGNGNPEATEYVVRVVYSGNTRYLGTDGQLQSQPTWLAGSYLATAVVITNLTAGTSYTVDVKARNVSLIETPWSSAATLSTITPSTPNFTLGVTNLEFGQVCINTTTSAEHYFEFTPNNIPNGQQISVYALNGFTYSTTPNGTYQNGLFLTNSNGATIRVYVRFTPTAVQPYPDTVDGVPGTINVNTANAGTLNVPVSGEGVNTPATATTGTNSNVTVTAVTIAGQLTQGCSAVTAYGIEYSTTPAFADGTGTTIAASNLTGGAYSVDVTGLTACTTYYYKAYVTDAAGTHYGTQDTFTTLPVAAPVTSDATNITQQSFTANWTAVQGATGYYLDVSTSPDFETVFLNEDFANMVAPAAGETDYNIAVTTTATPEEKKINSLTASQGWAGTNVYAENGSVRVATASGTHYLTTPTVNLSSTGGVATIYITAKYDVTSSNRYIRIIHAANGTTFSATLQTILLTDEFVTYSIPVTTGTANSKFRIQTGASNLNRFHISDIKVSNPGNGFIPGYNNLQVTTGNSYEITGLDADTKYYYRVRAYGANCTSNNSDVKEVQTLKYLTLAESDLVFGDVCVSASDAGSFKFTAGGMTDATLTIAALAGYTYATTVDGEYTNTLQLTGYNGGETTIYVKFAPEAVQAYDGNITVQGVAPYELATLTIPVSGAGILTPAVATVADATAISFTTAGIAGTATPGNCAQIGSYGVEYSTTPDFANGEGTQLPATNINGEGNFTVALSGLVACTTYYYKAYVTDATGTYYSEQKTFTTPTLGAPVAGTGANVTQTTFTANWTAVEGATGYNLDVSTDPDFEHVILTEDFSGIPGAPTLTESNDITATINNYTSTTGWTGQRIFGGPEQGNVQLGDAVTGGFIRTPSLDLSGNGGNITISFRAKYYGTDAKRVTVHHFANGSTSPTDALSPQQLTPEFQTFTTTISNGSTNSQLRFFPQGATPQRFHVDDIKIYYSMLLPGYDNLPVTGLSHEVTGLIADTKYYYRVRPQGGNCSSANSETIEVHTLKYFTAGETDLAFGDICTNATDTGSFKFTASGMTNATLNVNTVEGYTYATTENGEYTPTLQLTGYNGAETTIYVRFSPAAVQAYNGTIVVQGEAPYEGAVLEFEVIGAGIFTPATATSGAATAITATSASITATSVSGNCTTNTEYGIEYSTVNNFANGSGTQATGAGIDAEGNYTVILENLLPCKTYYYKAYTKTSGSPVHSAIRSFTTSSIGVVEALDGTDMSGTTFTANWEAVNGATGYRLDVSTSPEFGTGNFGTDLIISEYIEGSSNNKALEIYNGTGAAVSLSGYSLRQQANGSGSFGSTAAYTFNFPAVSLPAGSTYVIKSNGAGSLDIAAGHPANLTSTLAYADANGGIVVHFTGNDAVGLFKGSTMIDVIGVVNSSSNWGADKTFRRKSTVLSPSATYTASQWDEFAQNNSGLGAHTFNGGLTPSFLPGYNNLAIPGGDVTSFEVTGLAPFTKYYYRLRANSADCAATANSDVIEVITRGTVTWKTVAGVNKWVPEFYADGTTPLVIDETVDTAIEANYAVGAANNFNPKSITVSSGIFTVTSGNTFRVENDIINNAGAANFVVENNANLIQGKEQNNNQGAITVNRNTSPLFRNDYVMWSSPVAGQGLVDFSPHTAEGRYYQYNPAGEGNGQYVDASGNFEGAKGYLIRMPNSAVYSGFNEQMQPVWLPTGAVAGTTQQYNNFTATMVFSGKFTGVPNNGDIPVTLSNAGHSYHLIGNPYPSPLNLPAFLSANSSVVTGTVYVWRKKNASNGTSAYITMNRTGQYADNGEPNTTEANPAGIIRTGQGFIVQMIEEPASSQVMFNNTMRSDDTSNQFFRNGSPVSQAPESHGVYLNLTNTDGVYSQMYTGYIEGATEGRDNGIDSEYINDKATVLSTVMAGKEFIIHGRALPFNSQNTEPLQLRVATEGEYKIAIDRTEGSFTTQDIYLQDNMLNITHNIKAGPYTFTTDAGTFANRFEIVYSPEGTLGTDKPVVDESSVVIFKQDNVLKINSAKEDISSVTVYDIRGRKLYEATDVNSTSAQTNGLQSEQQVLIVKVKTANGAVVSKKVIF